MSALGAWAIYRRLSPFVGLAIIPLLILLAVTKAHERHWHKQANRFEALYRAESAGRAADRAAYTQAQKDAAAKNLTQVKAIEQRQEAITDATASDYRRQLADLRLRSQDRAAQGSTGKPGVSQVPQAAAGADGEAGVPLSSSELLRAAELELQLDQLITWVERQLAVDPNAPPLPSPVSPSQ